MRDPWHLGKQFRSVLEMQDWKLPPSVEPPDDLALPPWAEYLLVTIIVLAVLGLVAYGIWIGPALAQ